MARDTRPNPRKALAKVLRPVYLTDEQQRDRMMCKQPRPWPLWRERDVQERLHAEGRAGNPLLATVTAAYENGYYSVLLRPVRTPDGEAVHLMISCLDPFPVRDWHDLMRIKNELVGPEWTAVEVYPPAGDVVDGADLTHLWVLPPALQQRMAAFTLMVARPAPEGDAHA